MVRIHRSNIHSEKVMARRHKRRVRIFLLVIIVITAITGTGVWFFRYPHLMIAHVVVGETKILDGEAVQEYIEQKLNEKYLFIFPKRHVLLYPERDIREGVLANFSWLKDATIAFGENRSLLVDLTERHPTYLWCRDPFPFNEMSDADLAELCYFTDDAGYLFAQAPYFSDI